MTASAGDSTADVPSPVDFQGEAAARAWADAAERKRPWRSRLRAEIARELAALPPPARVLELGAGPGYLAEVVLDRCPGVREYLLLDFSTAMLALARGRLSHRPEATFLRGDFRDEDWTALAPGPWHAVVAMQAVHEVRHKRHVPRLYRQIHDVLASGAPLLVCDHQPRDDSNRETSLFMTEHEQLAALATAGFAEAAALIGMEGLTLYRGRKP